MFECFYDEKKNLITIKYEKIVDVKDVRILYTTLQAMLPKCEKGFKLLADLSLVEIMEEDVLPLIKKVMDLCNRHGVSEVIRIIPDPDKDIGLNIMSFFHYSKDVKVVNCQSLEQVRL